MGYFDILKDYYKREYKNDMDKFEREFAISFFMYHDMSIYRNLSNEKKYNKIVNLIQGNDPSKASKIIKLSQEQRDFFHDLSASFWEQNEKNLEEAFNIIEQIQKQENNYDSLLKQLCSLDIFIPAISPNELSGLYLLYITKNEPIELYTYEGIGGYISFFGKDILDDQGCVKKLLYELNFDTDELNRKEKDENNKTSPLWQIGYICVYLTNAFTDNDNEKKYFKVKNILNQTFLPIHFTRQLRHNDTDLAKKRLLRTAIMQWLNEDQRRDLYYADIFFESTERLIFVALDFLMVWSGLYVKEIGTKETVEHMNKIVKSLKNDISLTLYTSRKPLPRNDFFFHIAMAISANKSVNTANLYVRIFSSIRSINKLIEVSDSRSKLFKQFHEIRDYSTPNSYEEIMQDYGDSIRKYFPNYSDDKIKQLWDIAVKLSVIVEWYNVGLSRDSIGEFVKAKIAMTRRPNKSWYQENKIQTEKLRLYNIIACMEIIELGDAILLKKVSRTNRYVFIDKGESDTDKKNSREKSLFDILMNYRRWTTPELDLMLSWWSVLVQIRRLCSDNVDTIVQSIIDSAEAIYLCYEESLRSVGSGGDELSNIKNSWEKMLSTVVKMTTCTVRRGLEMALRK